MKKHQESAGIYRPLLRARRAEKLFISIIHWFTNVRRGFRGYCWRSLRHDTELNVRHKENHRRYGSLQLTLSLSLILPQAQTFKDSFSSIIFVRPHTQKYPRFDRILFGVQHCQDIKFHTGQRYREVADIPMIDRR